MTKHVSPEITGTELSTDYIRDIGGVKTLMCESKRFPGVFVGLREMSAEEVSEDTGPVVRETESFDDTIEVREDVTWKLVGLELGKHFETRGLHEDDGPKDDSPKDNKPRRRKPAGCRFPLRRPAYVRPVFIAPPKDDSEPCKIETFSLWVGNKEVLDFSLPAGLPVNYWHVNDAAVEDQPVDTELEDASNNRAKIERYDVEYPQDKYPDSKIFPRKPRNSSPTHEKPSLVLNALMEYRRLNESLEPLQTIYGKADGEKYVDGENYGDGEGEGEERSPDAELENRPSVEEMEARCANVVIMYPLTFLWHYIIAPIVVDIECIGHRKGTIPELEDGARQSLAAFWRRSKAHQAAWEHPYWPQAKRKTKKQIGIVVDRTAKRERLNINDVDMSKPWSICRIGGLRFATTRRLTPRKIYYRGTLTHYVDSKNPNRWHREKEDVAGTPYARNTTVVSGGRQSCYCLTTSL